MHKHRLLTPGLLALTVAGLLVPTVALAGKPVTSGQQRLQIKASLTPAKAGAKDVTLGLHVSYTNPQHPGQQPPYDTKTQILVGQYATHPTAVPACKESAVVKAKGKTSGCPADTKVGTGTIVVNAAPTIKKPISGTVMIYNGVNDQGFAGHPKGARTVFLYVRTSIGVNGTYTYYIHKTPGGGTKLVSNIAKPAKPGITPGSYSIKQIDLKVAGGTDAKPYLSDLTACPGSWRFSFTLHNYFNQPPVTARDRVACT